MYKIGQRLYFGIPIQRTFLLFALPPLFASSFLSHSSRISSQVFHSPAIPQIPKANIIIVSDFPHKDGAEKKGIPFTGDEPGQFIRDMLDEVKLSLKKDTYITYLKTYLMKKAPLLSHLPVPYMESKR